ncbi:MAG: hypothetical protein MJ168_08800 [Clostridia bacterium]|nr:hypothetical protein [Clostridia bacterium]
MKIKRIISILLAVLMLTSVVSLFAFAENEAIARVTEYLNAPSQYTNNGAFGINIDSTLDGKVTSLGNFGGYVVYEFNEPVMNSDKHAYGVDFIVSGNAFNAALTTQEPGQVWVSQDGENWFALAGSEHYEDETVWDYSITYTKLEERKCTFTDSLGDSGTVSPAEYPVSENYPIVVIPENDLTLSGILLRKQRTPSMDNGIQTSFGYVDTHKNSGASPNPYCENHAADGRDGQFDISWAVDKDGYGVELNWIKYVKVQTATFIDGALYGEKSTEISSVALADEAKEPVGKTSAPEYITVDGTALDLGGDSDYFEVDVDGDFDINVGTDANVYINNAYGTSRHFSSQTEKGIVRVIVQSDNCEPLIYYINTGKGNPHTDITPPEKEDEAEPVSATVSFSMSGTDNQIMKHEITVSSDIAEKYGYETAKKDHNGVKIDGVTVFDVIVASHEELYGDSFKNNPENYLIMGSSFIMKAYGRNAAASGFIVNGVMPNDGIYNADFNGCTGYACDTAVVNDGDSVTYFFYKDSKFFSDCYSWFDCDTYSFNADDDMTVNLSGYCAIYYGINEWQTILDKYAEPLEGIEIYAEIDGEKVLVGTTDKNGNARLNLTGEGEYVIFSEGETEDGSPIITNYAVVTVNPAQGDGKPHGFIEWVKHIWNSIKNWFVKVFNFLFGWIGK